MSTGQGRPASTTVQRATDGSGILSLRGIVKSFGAVRAVDEVDLDVAEGTLTCLIGPNGAGKSTLLHTISGFARQDAGTVVFAGEDVSRWRAHDRARAGLGTVFQMVHPVEGFDVRRNVMVGCHTWTRGGFGAAIFRPPSQRREERLIREETDRVLELVGLAGIADRRADDLPFGQLRLLAIARALAQRPRLLLLDEPVAGLRAAEKERLASLFRDLRERSLTLLLVEHDMRFVSSVADRVVVLARGRMIADGTAAEVRRDEHVVTAYLGGSTT